MVTDNNKNKLGMFVHWGVYSMVGFHEQVLNFPPTCDQEQYEKDAFTFNPVNYDPEKWVLAAKDAGFEYICFTAKHHDGFCMWDTKTTDYNIMNTPYGKDVLKMLADACEKHGMMLSIYYSNPDWHYEYGFNPASSHQNPAKYKDKIDIEKLKAYEKSQIAELMSNYGKIYTLFWDIPPHVYDPSINEFVRSLQPGIYINDRGFDDGDFSTPERGIGGAPNERFDHMTEACFSVGARAWGYRKNEDYHTSRYLTSVIDQTMARGGSFLLNVGPKPDGTIDETSLYLIAKIGDWYKRMDGCLKEHEGDPYTYGLNGVPHIVTKKNGKSYFHFFNGLTTNSMIFTVYPSMPKSVKLMNTGKQLEYEVTYIPSVKPGCLRVSGIPMDTLETEVPVIEVEW